MKNIKFYSVILIFLLYINVQGKGFDYSSFSLIDTTKPVIVHTPIQNTPKVLWPVSVIATVSDSSGIDSVWVKWYRNNPSNSKRFKLNNTAGNNYSALFNSINSEVNYYDSVFYRIFAQDNSSNHNIDSTSLNKFKILLNYGCCAGYGTNPSNYPFTTYWMDGRTQILITAAELTSIGFYPNMPIFSIGFYVQSVSPQVMNGFCVAFQNTSLTSLTGFVEPGWIIGYYGTYALTSTGLQTIYMQNFNYHWNGTSNMLIEVCYDNSSYTSFSVVNSTSAPGMTWGYYTDNSSGCSLTGGVSLPNRPNVCFMIPDKVKKTNSIIPDKYSLYQNFPNPFNPVTRINFDIPKSGFVILKVFDILGRVVRTLVNEEKPAGSYSVDFNATDLTSGIYFYKMETEGFIDVKRMVIIK